MRCWVCLVVALTTAFISTGASARDLVIGFANHSAPFVLPDQDHPGISVEIVRKSFQAVGHDVKPVYQSYKRIKEEVKRGRLDAAAGAMPEGQEDLYYSEPCIAFDNVAIVRKRDDIKIRTIADLPGHRVVAWQNAHDHLGGEFQKLFGRHVREDYVRKYFDLADQTAQV
ncbi:MAG: substrate-binding periplasmic protein, partial [Geminicoccaceae bacterium]